MGHCKMKIGLYRNQAASAQGLFSIVKGQTVQSGCALEAEDGGSGNRPRARHGQNQTRCLERPEAG